MAPPELGRDQLWLLQRLCFGDDAFDEGADRAFAEEDEDENGLPPICAEPPPVYR